MKIGIMTFWWSNDNYGQILQCYALQKYLSDVGHDAYLIRYDPLKDYVKTPLWRKILKVFNPVKLFDFLTRAAIERMNEQRDFDGFRNKYIKQSERIYYSYQELAEDPPEADVYIVGSDQVWNTFDISVARSKSVLRAYFLDFGDKKKKRIAYAASFGRERVSDDFIQLCKPLLKRFDYVSVREKSGMDICKRCGIDNAEWVLDPTMLLGVNIYRDLYKTGKFKMPNASYCLIYIIGRPEEHIVDNTITWAQKKNLSIIYVSGNSKYDKYKKNYATILDWLFLISHAAYVITNSYHATIFSLLFNKKFGIIGLRKLNLETNIRFISLFEQFSIEPRFVNANDFGVLDKAIDYDNIKKMIFDFGITNGKQLESVLIKHGGQLTIT
jgi:hypothetical protein